MRLSVALAIAPRPHHERVAEQAHREREADGTLVRALLLGRVFAELPAPGLDLGGVGPHQQERLDQRIGGEPGRPEEGVATGVRALSAKPA